jgi:hypothetical protein
MDIKLDEDEKAMIKQLYESWQQTIASAQVLIRDSEAKRKTLEKCIQQVTQVHGTKIEDYKPEEWILDLGVGALSRKKDDGNDNN